ncbi:hypothetical protein SAMN05216436_10540 [bacterium A37T11]|nr:hypothetical protein SAMN05216436_10540 [bacterium A37T11]
MDKVVFKTFWYSTGTQSFLLKLLKMDDNLETVLQESIDVSDTFTDGQALEDLDPIALMFQAGYLTIKGYDMLGSSYQLHIPNEEVRKALTMLQMATKAIWSMVYANTPGNSGTS